MKDLHPLPLYYRLFLLFMLFVYKFIFNAIKSWSLKYMHRQSNKCDEYHSPKNMYSLIFKFLKIINF